MVLIRGVHRAEDNAIDLMLLQKSQAAHHLIKRSGPAFVHTIDIVQFLWPIHA